MDVVFLVLSCLSLLCAFAYAFVLFQALSVLVARARSWYGDGERMPLLLRLPPRLCTALLVMCFLAVVL